MSNCLIVERRVEVSRMVKRIVSRQGVVGEVIDPETLANNRSLVGATRLRLSIRKRGISLLREWSRTARAGAVRGVSLLALSAWSAVALPAGVASDADSSPNAGAGDLSKASTDKSLFLAAANRLGRSEDQDIALIGQTAGSEIDPKPTGVRGEKRADFSSFKRDRLVTSVTYLYEFRADGTYSAHISFVLSPAYMCIDVSDVVHAMGPPDKVARPRGSHISRDERNHVYVKDGVVSTFNFRSDKCATHLSVSAVQRHRGT